MLGPPPTSPQGSHVAICPETRRWAALGIPHCETWLLQLKHSAAGPPESRGKSAARIPSAGTPSTNPSRARLTAGNAVWAVQPSGPAGPFAPAPPAAPRGARLASKGHRQLSKAVYCGWLGWRGWRLYSLNAIAYAHLKRPVQYAMACGVDRTHAATSCRTCIYVLLSTCDSNATGILKCPSRVTITAQHYYTIIS